MDKTDAKQRLQHLARTRDFADEALVAFVRSLTANSVMSQGEVAATLGTTQSTVSRMAKRQAKSADEAPAQAETARSLFFAAASGDLGHDALMQRLRAIRLEPAYRSRNEADDDADGPNSVIHAYTAYDLQLITDDELDELVDAAGAHG